MSLQVTNDKTQYSNQTYIIDGGMEELNSKQDNSESTLIKSERDPNEVFIRDTVDISEVGQGRLQKLIEPGTENFKSGYYEELSKASATFKKAFQSLVTNAGTGIAYHDIDYSTIDNLMNKYQEIYKSIEENYSGSEKDDKLKELSDAYEFTVHKNIIKPIELQINQAKTDAETYESMQGFLQRVNEYHMQLGLGGSFTSSTAAFNNSTIISENIKQYQSMEEMLKSLEDNIYRDKNISSNSVKKGLQDIVSLLIEKVGTNEQKKEYASINLWA